MSGRVPVIILNNGYKCPALGLGTWKSKAGEVKQAVIDAITVGYRHVDCAFIYFNEKEVGEALRAKIEDGTVKRKDMFLTSKLWNTFHRPDLVEGACRRSLEDLGVDYLDLYLIHFPQAWQEDGSLMPKDDEGKIIPSTTDYVDTWRAMEGLVKKGLVRSIGVSNFNKRQLERIFDMATNKPQMVQIEVHPYLNNQKLIDFCRYHDVVVTAYSPLGSRDRPFNTEGQKELMDDETLKSVAERHGKSVAQIAIRYAIERELIVIPKSVNSERIAQNFDVLDFALTREDLDTIAALESNDRRCTLGDFHHPDYPFHDEH